MTDLLTAADLAERFGITEAQVLELRRKNDWPCVRLSRKVIRFTPEQVEQIIAAHATTARPAPSLPVVAGQTKASARRRRSA